MKSLRIVSLILLAAVLVSFAALPAAALEQPDIGASGAVLLDADTGSVLFSRNENERCAPASLTKMMTVLLAVQAVEDGSVALTDMVTASENCRYNMDEDSSTAGITAGEQMSLEDLLYCAMVASANEACNIIAEYIGGSIDGFVVLMNNKAAELGCTGTHFSNCNGLPDADNYSTPWDLSLIAAEALSHPKFVDICSVASWAVAATNLSGERLIKNTNELLQPDSRYHREYVTGIKTGYTADAGHCLASCALKNSINLLCVVVGCGESEATDETTGETYTDTGSFSDTIKLYDWVFNNFSYQEVIKSTDVLQELPVSMGTEGTVALRPELSIRLLLPNDTDSSSFQQNITIYSDESGEELIAPVNAGQVLGELTLTRDGLTYGVTNLVAGSTVELSRVYYIKSQIRETLAKPAVKRIITVLVIVALVYIALVIFYEVQRFRHLASLRAAKKARAQARAEAEARAAYRVADKGRAAPGAIPPKPGKKTPPPAAAEPADEPDEDDDGEPEHDYFSEWSAKK